MALTVGCPACAGTFEQILLRGVTVDRCMACMGLWFDPGELTLAAEIVRPLEGFESAPRTGMTCIRCFLVPLLEIPFPLTDEKIAACRACKAAFLEKGQLERIHKSLEHIVGESGKSASGRLRTAEILEETKKPPEVSRCPRCEKPLESLLKGGMSLDRCKACAATWFDAGELTAELGVSRKISLKEGQETRLLCPRCPNKTLVLIAYPRTAVLINVCPDCRGSLIVDADLEKLRKSLGSV